MPSHLPFGASLLGCVIGVAMIGCASAPSDSETTSQSELRYQDDITSCRLSIQSEDMSSRPRDLPTSLRVKVSIKWADATLDTLRGEGWTCTPVEQDNAAFAAQAQCPGSNICRRGSDEALIVARGVTGCHFRPELKKVHERELTYLYRREVEFEGGAASPGPGERALREAIRDAIENEREIVTGGYSQPLRIGPNARALTQASMYLRNIDLDETATNALVREWGANLPQDASLPDFPRLSVGTNVPDACVQAHLPSTVANGASFHLCGCR